MSNYVVNKLTCASASQISAMFNALTELEDFAFHIARNLPKRFHLDSFQESLNKVKLNFFGRLHQTAFYSTDPDYHNDAEFKNVVAKSFVECMQNPVVLLNQMNFSDVQCFNPTASAIVTEIMDTLTNVEYRGDQIWNFEVEEHTAENAFELAFQRLARFETAVGLLQALAMFYTTHGNSVSLGKLFEVRNAYRNSEFVTILLIGNLLGGKFNKRATKMVFHEQIMMEDGEFFGLMDLTDNFGDYPSSYLVSDRETLEQSLHTKFNKFMGAQQ
jgi:hypothetical protein